MEQTNNTESLKLKPEKVKPNDAYPMAPIRLATL